MKKNMLNLMNIYEKLVISNIKNTEEIPNVKEWERFLTELGQDDNPIAESFRKYKCRILSFGPAKRLLLNCISFAYLIISPCKVKKLDNKTALKNIAVKIEGAIESSSFFPESLYDVYDRIITVDINKLKDKNITSDAYIMYKRIAKKYFFHPYYLLLMKKDLIKYSNCMLKYNPNSIMVYDAERDVSSPIITYLMKNRNGKYISFMHGDYLLQIIQAHMWFSEYYIWDKSYLYMFKKVLKCNNEKYVVYTPNKLKRKYDFDKAVPNYYFTYYLSGESTKTLKILSQIISKLKKNGYKCLVRPHPRYSHWEMINDLFEKEQIELPQNVTMEASFARTKYVVGLSTTVLAEAQVEGKDIVIDNVTNPEQYFNLKKRYYRMLNAPHKTLDEIIKEAELSNSCS